MLSTQTRLFHSRFEMKYRISATMAAEIGRFLSHHMHLDYYSAKAPGRHYRNNSLYLDTPALQCYHDAEHGDKNRFKLRLRWYDDNPDGALFLEEKRRTTDSISKVRVAGGRALIESLLSGFFPLRSHFQANTPEVRAEMTRLMDAIQRLNARPHCFVRYWREAWTTERADYLRVTFDREVEGHEVGPEIPPPDSPGWRPTEDARTILEIKFYQTMPGWLQQMIRVFELQRCSVPKYTMSVNAVGLRPRSPEAGFRGMMMTLPRGREIR